jgi:dCMP deaminase
MTPRQIRHRMMMTEVVGGQSRCVRRHFGAIITTADNVVVSDGYNGPPRGSHGHLCDGHVCEREGARFYQVTNGRVHYRGRTIGMAAFGETDAECHARLMASSPGVPTGESPHIGCYHAEANAITNAARIGRSTMGCTLFVQGEPCIACARAIYHAGIEHVVVRSGGYSTTDGIDFLRQRVKITYAPDPTAIAFVHGAVAVDATFIRAEWDKRSPLPIIITPQHNDERRPMQAAVVVMGSVPDATATAVRVGLSSNALRPADAVAQRAIIDALDKLTAALEDLGPTFVQATR